MTVYLPAEQDYIDKLAKTVKENFSNPGFGVDDLAREMGISHSSLHRKLKSISKQSVSQFIRETRLKHAMELLKQQSLTVAEVAYEVGFGSTTYFSKCFHDYYGYPPGEVRKKQIWEPVDLEDTQFLKDLQDKINSIAVLPFDNYTGDENQTFLISGMHDALINELGQLGTIRVISKTSALAYSNSEKTIKEIATELEVDAIVEASVLTVESKVKIQLKLFKAFPKEQQIWSQSFEVKIQDILKLYGNIISEIAGEINVSLSPEQKIELSKKREVNPESYKAYLRGKYNLYQLTPEGIKKGLEYLHEAVKIDPAEPFAYAGLALGYLDVAHGPFNPGDAYAKAEWAANQAVLLDDKIAEAQLALGEINIYSKWKFNEGEEYYKRSLELNPYLSIAHYHYSWALYLFGRNDEAIAEHKLAQKYDPFNPMHTGFLALMHSYMGNYDDSIREAHKSFELYKDFPIGYFALGETYLATGKKEEAVEATEKLVAVAPEWGWFLAYIYATTGHKEKAELILKELEQAEKNGWIAMGLAVLYGAMGKYDDAFKWIKFEPHHVWIPWIAVMPMWKPLHTDPRHGEFVRRLKLPGS